MTNQNKSPDPNDIPPIPKDIEQLAASAEAAGRNAATEYSKFRTRMSEHRTNLSDDRTTMSERRTALSDERSHMANERTHLAQIRTAISLMSFGVTLNRFSIYLQENDQLPDKTYRALSSLRDVEYVGGGMVVLGIILLIWSLYRYRKVRDAIINLNYTTPDLAITILTVSIILLGAGSAVWMIFD